MSVPTVHRLRWLLPSLAMLVAGCATVGHQPPADMDWRLAELDGVTVATPAGRRGPYIRLLSEGARVTGFTTCNNLFGRYESGSGDRLRFVTLGSTRMACVEADLSRQEQQFMTALQAVDRFTVSRGTLTLFQGRQPRMRFVAGR